MDGWVAGSRVCLQFMRHDFFCLPEERKDRFFTKSLYRCFEALPHFDLLVPRMGTTGTHWENFYGSVLSCAHCGGLWFVGIAGLRLRKITEVDMTWVYFVAGGVVVGLLIYLVIALLKPELF
ncbi:potassium-transporting ATPase subunit F [Ferrovum sp.]|jgi:K+-transporting ATPase KdpF subunit|uniref:potassium-transporting ATPase subunit F n=1 Tax=Ferrovum sp. TaxID=2609467 RepID=UPI00260EC00F|nr:potassium-transporting ATPase subunit F [Ferrovum sp.]